MGVNICRQFILHNDLIPPTERVHEWDYLAFGYYDGVSVGENIFQSDNISLNKLWHDSAEMEEDLDGTETMQIVYGFRTENDKEENKDRDYWQDIGEKTPYPFLFFVMIQFDRSEEVSLEKLLPLRKKMEEKFTIKSEMKGITYLTLENSDLFLVLRCKDYNRGAEIVDDIHRREAFYQDGEDAWKIKYSFTVSAVDKSFLNHMEAGIPLKGNMNCAHIYAAERKSGSIDCFYQVMKERLEKIYPKEELEFHIKRKQSVLGYNDELIQIMDLPWDVFLEFYKDTTGMLNHSSDIYQKCVACITTIIGLEQKESKILTEIPDLSKDESKGTSDKEFLNEFCRYLKNTLKEISEYNSASPVLHKNMVLSLNNLINSFSKFFNSHISENLFFPSVCSINMLVMILREVFSEKRRVDIGESDYYEECRRFLNALNLYAQNSARSDRQFTQAMEFNVRIYNVPVKLNAFYNAFVSRVKDFLNESFDTEGYHLYEFLICPGMSGSMYVEELFKGQSADKRLFLVNMPENQTYDMERMMFMLCHEVAHFVGSSIRSREARSKYIQMALCHMIALNYRYYLKEMKGTEFSEFWEEFEKELNEQAEKYHELLYNMEYVKKQFSTEKETQEEDEEQLRKMLELEKACKDHSATTKIVLQDSMIKIIKEQRKKLFEAGLYQVYMKSYRTFHDEEKAERAKEIQQDGIGWCSEELIRGRKGENNIINIENMIDMLMWYCKECLSDIVGIMILKISPEQYYNALFQSAKDNGAEGLFTSNRVNDILIRASLVTACMIQKEKMRDWTYEWKLESISAVGDRKIQKFVEKIRGFIDNFMNILNPNLWSRSANSMKVSDYMCDKTVLDYICRYLLECRVKVDKRIEEREEIQKEILEMFSLTEFVNVQQDMIQIQCVIEKYREKVNCKIKEMVTLDENKK